jgi:hypothetical protein
MRQMAATEPRKKAANLGNAEARRPRNHKAKKLTKTPNARATGRPHIERDFAIGAPAKIEHRGDGVERKSSLLCGLVLLVGFGPGTAGRRFFTKSGAAAVAAKAPQLLNWRISRCKLLPFPICCAPLFALNHCSKFNIEQGQSMRRQSIQKLDADSLKKIHDSIRR